MSPTRPAAMIVVLLQATVSQAGYRAHEWGTFTSLVGSDGVTQNGMYHEDEKLPEFVHGFGEVQGGAGRPVASSQCDRVCCGKGCIPRSFLENNAVTQKMETPVIYFYSDRERHVDVNVRFPEGVVTETFPAPVSTFPTAASAPVLANGDTTFSVDILPTRVGDVPFVDAGNIYSHARNVASNLVRSGDEQEKFIFYRGIGRFQPRVAITSHDGALSVAAARPEDTPQAVFLVHVDGFGHGQMLPLERQPGERFDASAGMIAALRQHGLSLLPPATPILSGHDARRSLESALVMAGLNPDEATAMIDTWEHGYLRVPGLRLLYVLPRAEVDAVLPLTLTPAPDTLERVFVGRIEVLLDTEEERILADIRRYRFEYDVAALGRFAEPMLRRVREVHLNQSRKPDLLGIIDALIARAAAGEGGGSTTTAH